MEQDLSRNNVFLRFFANYAPGRFKYWRENSSLVFKSGLKKVIAALAFLTVGVGLGAVVWIFSIWWLGAVIVALSLMAGIINIISFHSFCYYNAWELGRGNAGVNELEAIARTRFSVLEQTRAAASDRRTERRRRSGRHPNRIRESMLDKALNIANIVILAAGMLLICFPLLNYFSLAFNNGNRNLDVILFPADFSLKPMEYVLVTSGAAEFWRSFGNSVVYTALVTIFQNLFTALAAYPLSKKDFPFRGAVLMFFIFTMLFGAGIMPIYLLVKSLGLLNTLWSIILTGMFNAGNMLYYKTFFEGIPSDVEEAAILDGANDLQLFFYIVVPMSLPIIGTCCFFTLVGCWNGYGGAMIYIDQSEQGKAVSPLAYYIYLMIAQNSQADTITDPWVSANIDNIEAAAMLASIIPILCVYPFVVKYIRGGLQLGSVKG